MTDTVAQFYDQLADDYHLIFIDWHSSVIRQGEMLDTLIRRYQPEARTVLDCTCGIGTQAIGLAKKGYVVHATDLSPDSVERAKREAENFGVKITAAAADVRTLDCQVEGQFDVVISFDNALPHLLTDDDLHQAAKAMAAKLAPGGFLLTGIRDYDQLVLERPQATPPQMYNDPQGRRVVFQLWDWQGDQPFYIVNLFIVREIEGVWQTTHHATTYRALQRAELDAALKHAGLSDIHWMMPQENGLYQPVVVARKS